MESNSLLCEEVLDWEDDEEEPRPTTSAKATTSTVVEVNNQIQQRNAPENTTTATLLASTSTNDGKNTKTAAEDTAADLDNAQLNEALENYAQTYNLTAQKVKNIIFHIVKNPQTFATLIRKDPDAMAGLRMTRSRLRQLERIAKRSITPAELKPINVPKTFLDVNYGEEEDDEDYNPGTDATIANYEEESGESSSSGNDDEGDAKEVGDVQTGKLVIDGKEAGHDTIEECVPMEEDTGTEFLTEVDNPIYPMFIRSVMGDDTELDPATKEQLYNEENDPEYNIFQDLDDICGEDEEADEDKEYEFRKDRATEIPRWELKALEEDFVDVPSALDVPVDENLLSFLSTPSQAQNKPPIQWPPVGEQQRHEAVHVEQPQQPTSSNSSSIGVANMPRVERINTPAESYPNNVPVGVVLKSAIYDKSTANIVPNADVLIYTRAWDKYSAIRAQSQQGNLAFTGEQLTALRVQLEKHVQLLCQCIVGTTQYPELLDVRNRAVQMLRDLDDESEKSPPTSLFNISNLQSAILSAHEIEACQDVALPLQNHNESQPSNKTMWVLARSEACRYPELLPPNRFTVPTQPQKNTFLPSEQLLLALGLYQIRDIHGYNTTYRKGKFSMIAEHFLPIRNPKQIHNHLKNARSCAFPTVIQRIIRRADRGIFEVKYRPDLGESALPGMPLNWPPESQPYWLKWWIAGLFQGGSVGIAAITLADTEGVQQQLANIGGCLQTVQILQIPAEQLPQQMDNTQKRSAPKNHTKSNGNGQPAKKRLRLNNSSQEAAHNEEEEEEVILVNEEEEQADDDVVLVEDEAMGLAKNAEILTAQRDQINSTDKRKRGNFAAEEFDTAVGPSYLITGPEESNSNEQFATSPSGVEGQQNCNNKTAENVQQKDAENQQNGTAEPQQQKKSRRKLRAERGLAALASPEARDNMMQALIGAVYADFKQRMFMHQDKLRAVQSILKRPGLSTADRFTLLWDCLGQSHPQLFFLFAAIAPEYELPSWVRLHAERLATKKALHMIHTIQTYMGGSRSSGQIKNTFKFLKEVRDTITSEDKLFELFQRHFGVRDEPLWRLLKREWMGARFQEKVEDWQYESVDLDRLQADPKAMEVACQYETVKIPYRHDPTERSRLRVRHGRVTVELNGRLRNVTIEYPDKRQSENDKNKPNESVNMGTTTAKQNEPVASTSTAPNPSTSTRTGTAPAVKKWTRAMDEAMLLGYTQAKSYQERRKSVLNFLTTPLGKSVTQAEAEDRLRMLLGVAKQLQNAPATGSGGMGTTNKKQPRTN